MNEIEETKQIFESSQNYLKSLIDNNYKLRNYLFRLLTECFNFNDNKEESLKIIFEILIKNQQIKSSFEKLYGKTKDLKQNSYDKLFQKYFKDWEEQNKEIDYINYISVKSTFINAFFKGFFNIDKDQTMKDFLKEENQKNMMKFLQSFKNSSDIIHKIKRINNSMNKSILEKIFQDINLPEIKTKVANYKTNNINDFLEIYIKIQNVCIINLQINYSNVLKDFNLTVGGLKEHSNFIVRGFGNRDFPNSLKSQKIRSKSKSKFLLLNKLENLFNDFFENNLRVEHYYSKNIMFQSIIILIKYASKFANLYKKKCAYCGKIIKYNSFDKSLFPPFLFFNLEKELFYHEDCLSISRNQSA